jgi:hypothetical protein
VDRGLLSSARWGHAASAIGEVGYVFGGVDESGNETDDMQRYIDIGPGSRAVGLPMASPRRREAAAATL